MDELEADFPPFSFFCDEITNWLLDIGQSEAELAPEIQDVHTTRPTLPTNELPSCFASAKSEKKLLQREKNLSPRDLIRVGGVLCHFVVQNKVHYKK